MAISLGLDTLFTPPLVSMSDTQFQVRAVQMAYVPPHERTQEIDIDAMLDYSDSQEETDEAGAELEEEHKDSETGQIVQVEEVWKREEEAILFEIGKHTCSDDGSAPGIRR